MARDVTAFDAFAARMTAPLSGLAQLLTGDREAAATLVYTALVRTSSERAPDERRAIAALVRAWLAGAPPVGEHEEELPYDLELLRRSLDALPEKQRVAVALHHWSGFSVPEIAAVTRRPERAVAADLAAGVAELHEPATPVDARLAALVAATEPPHVDLAQVREAGLRQRRHRRRAAIAAAAVLLAAGTVAALLTGGEPEPATAGRTPVRVVDRYGQPPAEIDGRARRLTAQLATAMPDLLPDFADRRDGAEFPPPEFSVNSADGPHKTYFASAAFDATTLFFVVDHRTADTFVPCVEPGQDCTYRQFPDGTVAEVVVHPEADMASLSLNALRPDGTTVLMMAGGPQVPQLTVEDMFRFATVFTY